jgi:hypothetical protein
MVARHYAMMKRVARGTMAIRARVPLALPDTIQPFPTFSEAFYVAPAELATRISASA